MPSTQGQYVRADPSQMGRFGPSEGGAPGPDDRAAAGRGTRRERDTHSHRTKSIPDKICFVIAFLFVYFLCKQAAESYVLKSHVAYHAQTLVWRPPTFLSYLATMLQLVQEI